MAPLKKTKPEVETEVQIPVEVVTPVVATPTETFDPSIPESKQRHLR